MSVKGDLITLIESFLFKVQQRVVLNGQLNLTIKYEGMTIKFGVSQG